MISNDVTPMPSDDPEWADVVMKTLPGLYVSGHITGGDDFVFVYATTFFAVGQELQHGATAGQVRAQLSELLRFIDESGWSTHDKELFAALVARAADDAIEGRAPCVLH
jgi:hypothetical protein